MYLTLLTNFQGMLCLMKLKGCMSLLNILWGYSIITFALKGRRGSIKMQMHVNSGEGSYVSVNIHT